MHSHGSSHDVSRDLTKTISFACIHFSVAFAVGYLLTGSLPVATGLALIEPMVNTVAFFFHERAWRLIERARGTGAKVVGGV